MSDKDAVFELLERLPKDVSLQEIARSVQALSSGPNIPKARESRRVEPIETEEGFLMLPSEISSAEITRAIREDRDAR